LLNAAPAAAGNLDSFSLGNDAALQGGAITADVSGGGAAWYKPAGLARLPGLRLDAGASAYVLRFGGAPDIDAVGEGAQEKHLTTLSCPAGSPSSTRRATWGWGFGVFVPNQHTLFSRTRAERPIDASGLGVDLAADAHACTLARRSRSEGAT
jgi:hypothetical protein